MKNGRMIGGYQNPGIDSTTRSRLIPGDHARASLGGGIFSIQCYLQSLLFIHFKERVIAGWKVARLADTICDAGSERFCLRLFRWGRCGQRNIPLFPGNRQTPGVVYEFISTWPLKSFYIVASNHRVNKTPTST